MSTETALSRPRFSLWMPVPVLAATAGLAWLGASDAGSLGKPTANVVLAGVIGGTSGAVLATMAVAIGAFTVHWLRMPVRPWLPLEDGEVVLDRWRATHWLGMEPRGGTLRLTDRRILYDPDRTNFQLDPVSIPLGTVRALRAEDASVVVEADTEHRFGVPLADPQGPGGRLAQIEAAVSKK